MGYVTYGDSLSNNKKASRILPDAFCYLMFYHKMMSFDSGIIIYACDGCESSACSCRLWHSCWHLLRLPTCLCVLGQSRLQA